MNRRAQRRVAVAPAGAPPCGGSWYWWLAASALPTPLALSWGAAALRWAARGLGNRAHARQRCDLVPWAQRHAPHTGARPPRSQGAATGSTSRRIALYWAPGTPRTWQPAAPSASSARRLVIRDANILRCRGFS